MSSVVCKLYLDKPVIDNTYLLSMLYETKPEGTLLSDVGTARALGKEVPIRVVDAAVVCAGFRSLL